MKPRLLDLFCGAGGAAMGYHRAGFEVVGVDINPQPHYPFEFHQADAMNLPLGWGFDAIHASPPCQAYSRTSSLHDNEHPHLYVQMRDRLQESGAPWVIENVIGAPYEQGIVLCGSAFGLGVWRHRNFETSFLMLSPGCRHDLCPKPLDVTGTGGPCERPQHNGGGAHRKPRSIGEARAAMGIDWMSRRELSQAIPPAYTEYIGAQLLAVLS